ncbi:hypothetical protein [Sodalis praecaptivus]|uniref:hypothetical protein n=1 Tax=Sodalis TaxID=84565 RepID=UPI00046CEEC5|nr:hypothetical protein [Sodalis praecaptivus]
MQIHSKATDDGRMIALQVAFTALVDLWGRDRPELKKKLISFLEETGMDPENKRSSAAFYELIEMIRALEERRG